MKRKSLSYESWTCMVSRELRVARVAEPFEGYVALLNIHEVSEPQVWNWHGTPLTVCDRGMAWLMMLPERGGLCVTAPMNADGTVALWYMDMIAGQGVDGRGIPWFDDLYLDLIIHPDGSMMVDDRDELDEALRRGDITAEQHRQALEICEMLQKGLAQGAEPLQALTKQCFRQIKNTPAL